MKKGMHWFVAWGLSRLVASFITEIGSSLWLQHCLDVSYIQVYEHKYGTFALLSKHGEVPYFAVIVLLFMLAAIVQMLIWTTTKFRYCENKKWQIFTSVILPFVKPIVTVVSISKETNQYLSTSLFEVPAAMAFVALIIIVWMSVCYVIYKRADRAYWDAEWARRNAEKAALEATAKEE